jgi:hypothetical protein
MFDGYLRLFSSIHFGLLLILFIRHDITIAFPNSEIANINGEDFDTTSLSLVHNNVWIQVTMDPGKDQLNANSLRATRVNIMGSVFMITASVLILVIVGGIISVIIYYVKKK